MTSPEQQLPKESSYNELAALTDEVLDTFTSDFVDGVDAEYPVRVLRSYDSDTIAMLQEDLSFSEFTSLQEKMEELEMDQHPDLYIFEPQTALGKWLQRRRDKKDAIKPPIVIDEKRTNVVKIIKPLRSRRQSLRINTYPDCLALSVTKTSFSGHFTVGARDIELSIDKPVIAIDKMRYDPDDINGYIYPDDQEHYVLVPSAEKIYQPSMTTVYNMPALSDAQELNSALDSMREILQKIKTAT
ncbi:MAG: hypothetical protein ABI716_03390 [Candidatus Saccharibacteria bacterium]